MLVAAPYDLNTTRTRREAFSDAFNVVIDRAQEAAEAASRRRDYLGASQIGDECSRRIQFEILGAPAASFGARTLRIFDRGHRLEDAAGAFLIRAGFELKRWRADGVTPIGFSTAGGRFRGHVDGVIIAGPDIEGLVYPTIWENKGLGAKGWKALAKDGVAKAHPRYADQIALYQTYLDNQNPALLTAVNADTMEVWAELVAFDPARAQAASDRAVHILTATDAGDLLPRAGAADDAWPCSYCRFRDHCWKVA